MADIAFEGVTNVNVPKLDADLRAALPTFAGLSLGASGLTLHFSAPPSNDTRATAEQIVTEHNPDELTPEQQAQAERQAALDALAQLVASIDLTQPLAPEDADTVTRYIALKSLGA